MLAQGSDFFSQKCLLTSHTEATRPAPRTQRPEQPQLDVFRGRAEDSADLRLRMVASRQHKPGTPRQCGINPRQVRG
jgi:hypothetical protein